MLMKNELIHDHDHPKKKNVKLSRFPRIPAIMIMEFSELVGLSYFHDHAHGSSSKVHNHVHGSKFGCIPLSFNFNLL